MAFPYSDSTGNRGAYDIKGARSDGAGASGFRDYTQQFDEHRLTDTEIPSSTGGFTQATQFQVSSAIWNDGTSKFTCVIRGGYLVVRNPQSGGEVFVRVKPKIGEGDDETELGPDETAELSVGADEKIYLKFETDYKDQLTAEDPPDPAPDPAPPPDYKVDIVVQGGDEGGTHYQPRSPNDSEGVDGVYYYLLAELEVDPEDSEAATVKQIQDGGPIYHSPNLWEGVNVGGFAGVYKQRKSSDDTFEFRTIYGKYGVEAREAGDQVQVDVTPENVGHEQAKPIWVEPRDGNGDIYTDPADYPSSKLKLRKIKGLDSPQIKVLLDPVNGELPDEITIRGNEFNDPFQTQQGTSLIDFTDGLAVDVNDDIEEVEVKVCEHSSGSNPTVKTYKFLGWEVV